jgi:site-specific recombinase XerD
LDHLWRPKIGTEVFEKVKYSVLVKIIDARELKKKTYNNVSTVRCAFEYGYRDHPEMHNPASGLKCFRISKKDRPVIDPFTIQEAEALIDSLPQSIRTGARRRAITMNFGFSPDYVHPNRLRCWCLTAMLAKARSV